jgi:zinc transport system substrate-binding protein
MRNESIPVVIITAALVLMLAFSCASEQPEQEQKLTVAVSIPPQKSFVERIAGDLVKTVVMVPPGQSPSTYEPTTGQLQQLSNSAVFFTIGVPFEQSFIPLLRQNLPDLGITATDATTPKRRFETGHTHEEVEEGDLEEGAIDPHIWMSPVSVMSQAQIIAEELAEIDPEHAQEYYDNLESFTAELEQLDQELSQLLKPLEGETLLVYHPAFGYFADRYGLKQKAVEIGGKEPSPRQLEQLVEESREDEASIIFVQPEFDASSAQVIADAVGARVVIMGSLEEHYMENLRSLARKLKDLEL